MPQPFLDSAGRSRARVLRVFAEKRTLHVSTVLRAYPARVRRRLIDLAVDVGVGLLVVLIAYVSGQKPLALLVEGIVASFGTAIVLEVVGRPAVKRRLPRVALEKGDGFALRIRAPEYGGKRRLRQQTLELVKEIRVFLKAQPAPYLDSMREHTEMSGRMEHATEDQKRMIWNEFTLKTTERYARETQDLAERFGGRLAFQLGEYHRVGLVGDGDMSHMQWMARSIGWLGQVATDLEALALRL